MYLDVSFGLSKTCSQDATQPKVAWQTGVLGRFPQNGWPSLGTQPFLFPHSRAGESWGGQSWNIGSHFQIFAFCILLLKEEKSSELRRLSYVGKNSSKMLGISHFQGHCFNSWRLFTLWSWFWCRISPNRLRENIEHELFYFQHQSYHGHSPFHGAVVSVDVDLSYLSPIALRQIWRVCSQLCWQYRDWMLFCCCSMDVAVFDRLWGNAQCIYVRDLVRNFTSYVRTESQQL